MTDDGWFARNRRGKSGLAISRLLSRIFPLPTYLHILIPRYVPQKIGKRKSPPIKAGLSWLACGLSYAVKSLMTE
jgi:hypothetical protein